jgi:short-subunit dehydrogenase
LKEALVTGASSGIGAETAVRLAGAGHAVVLAARRAERLEAVAERCRAAGAASVRVEVADLGDLDAARVLGASLGRIGREPVVVNNAGFGEFGDYAAMSWDRIAEHVRVMLLGPMALVHGAVPAMLAHGSGHIVNVLSITIRTPLPGTAAYAAAKAGLEGFSMALLAEHRRRGLRVTNVVPGATDTPIWDSAPAGPARARMVPATAVADAVSWAVSQPASAVVEEIVVTPRDGIL